MYNMYLVIRSDNKIGAAANVKSVKEVTRVARAVFDYTKHTFIAGSDCK